MPFRLTPFSDVHISQGSAATFLNCDVILGDDLYQHLTAEFNGEKDVKNR